MYHILITIKYLDSNLPNGSVKYLGNKWYVNNIITLIGAFLEFRIKVIDPIQKWLEDNLITFFKFDYISSNLSDVTIKYNNGIVGKIVSDGGYEFKNITTKKEELTKLMQFIEDTKSFSIENSLSEIRFELI